MDTLKHNTYPTRNEDIMHNAAVSSVGSVHPAALRFSFEGGGWWVKVSWALTVFE